MSSKLVKRSVVKKTSKIATKEVEPKVEIVVEPKSEKVEKESSESSTDYSSAEEKPVPKVEVKLPTPIVNKFETNEAPKQEVPKQEVPKPELPKPEVVVPKSIVEFDHNEVRKLDIGLIKSTDITTLLKILIVR